jgi:DNA primase
LFTDPPAEALAARGFKLESAREHEVLWDPKHNNWITPIRNPFTNKLMGWQEKGYVKRYFKNYPTGVEKSKALFGFRRYDGGRLIVVESPLDVVRLSSVGVSGGVATFGSLVSKEQVSLIRSADQIVFAFDNDDAGRLAAQKMLDLTVSLSFEAWFFNYSATTMKDVGGMSKAEILTGLETAKHSLHGLKAIV